MRVSGELDYIESLSPICQVDLHTVQNASFIKTHHFLFIAKYPCGRMNFIPALAMCFQITNQKLRRRSITLRGSHKMGDRWIFLNLRASLFNKDLSNGSNLGRIHLAGQYL
jgi:hypothetical protein